MSNHLGVSGRALALAIVLTLGPARWADAQAHVESVDTSDGQHLTGRVAGDPASGFTFKTEGGDEVIPLEKVAAVTFDGPTPDPASALPPFHVELGLGQRISGRLGVVSEAEVRLDDGPGHASVTVPRALALALLQRPGEVQLFQDGFETLDESRWSHVGEPRVVGDPKAAGKRSLRLAAGGTALTSRLPEPVGSGRLDVAFHDDGAHATGQRWFVDLTFRTPSGDEWVRAVLGWDEESLAVQSSPGGPALAVQRLARKPGWHRLAIRFDSGRTDLTVDGDELAHGNGPEGPLVEVRLASESTGKDPVPDGLAAHLDDLRLARFAEAVGNLEIEPAQDEVRLVGGDQLFGRVRFADADRLVVDIDGKDEALAWPDVAGVHFRRSLGRAEPIEGLLVRLEWGSAPGRDPRDVDQAEGALTVVSAAAFTLATPQAGALTIPRDRLRRMRILGRARRLLLDPSPHHLGDEICDVDPRLDPPQPEGGVLEVPFTLDKVLPGPAVLALDVVQVVGLTGSDPRFADQVKNGELRTNVQLNGKPIDYLNKYIASKNETPERIRLPIPAGLLVAGANRLRFEQVGTKDDPNQLDDLGLLGIALEFRPAVPDAEKPQQ